MDYKASSSSSGSQPESSSSQAENKLLDRVSTLFGGKKKSSNGSSSSSMAVNNTVVDDEETQADSLFLDERNDSCVDSMYSSLRSHRSGYQHTSSNSPAPLRTVQLNNPIVHLPTPPPPPPVPSKESPPPSATIKNSQRKSSPPVSSQQDIDDVEAKFKSLLEEYAVSSEAMKKVNDLTYEQKEMLLRSSRSPELKKRNSAFSNTISSFSLMATLGLKNKGSKRNSKAIDHQFFTSPNSESNSNSNSNGSAANFNHNIPTAATSSGSGSESKSFKAHTAPGRYNKSRSVIPGHDTFSRNTARSKLKSTPDYFVNLLKETHVRDLENSEILDLHVFLRSVVVSWTNEFLSQGGYEAITNLFKQMKEAPKRFPYDNKILQNLGKCLKTIMTHQSMGTQIVLTNPDALYHIRDLLFGPGSKKQKQMYGLDITTRSLLLNLLCTLATIQTSNNSQIKYVHGYDVLRRLLLDRPTDRIMDDDDDKRSQARPSPFPITLKTDPKEILQMIMERDPNGDTIGQEFKWDREELKPRYTFWMRELGCTAEKHIETMTSLSQVLNYDFNSAYRHASNRQQQQQPQDMMANFTNSVDSSGAVMTEEGVTDYIITHLRLIRTIVTTQPTSYVGCYDEQEQEKMRVELMLSGFDKISKILMECPHPIVRGSYIEYLKPLMRSCANLTPPLPPAATSSAVNSNGSVDPYQELDYNYDDDDDNYEISVYADDNVDDVELFYPQEHSEEEQQQLQLAAARERQWKYEQDPYIDDIYDPEESFEDQFDSDRDSFGEEEKEQEEKSGYADSLYSTGDNKNYTFQKFDNLEEQSNEPAITTTVPAAATTSNTRVIHLDNNQSTVQQQS